MTKDQKIFSKISEVVQKENELLQSLNNKRGIFYVPELALAYLIGRKIFQEREHIFESENDLKWVPEKSYHPNEGPTDLSFEVNQMPILHIEFKIRNTVDSYIKDIQKLQRLSTSAEKYFCAIIDTFNKENDDRILKLESYFKHNISRIEFVTFPTNQEFYPTKQVHCVISMWKLH